MFTTVGISPPWVILSIPFPVLEKNSFILQNCKLNSPLRNKLTLLLVNASEFRNLVIRNHLRSSLCAHWQLKLSSKQSKTWLPQQHLLWWPTIF